MLYHNISDYLLINNLTILSEDSLRKNIKDDTELKKIIENQGFKVLFGLRNGFQEVFIWDKETINNYEVVLPKKTINTKVVFIDYFFNSLDFIY